MRPPFSGSHNVCYHRLMQQPIVSMLLIVPENMVLCLPILIRSYGTGYFLTGTQFCKKKFGPPFLTKTISIKQCPHSRWPPGVPVCQETAYSAEMWSVQGEAERYQAIPAERASPHEPSSEDRHPHVRRCSMPPLPPSAHHPCIPDRRAEGRQATARSTAEGSATQQAGQGQGLEGEDGKAEG